MTSLCRLSSFRNKGLVAYVRPLLAVEILGLIFTIAPLGSPVCFVVASFNYPGAIKSAWGCMEDEMDDAAWDLLNVAEESSASNDVSRTLGMVVKMTRLHDLGLAQLCFDSEDATFLRDAAVSGDLVVS